MPSRADAQTSCASPSSGNPCVATAQFDNARDAWNSNETTITPSNVSALSLASFSPLAVDTNDLPATARSNPIYAQPLYVAGIHTSLTNCNPSCNMVLGATLNGTVFAWNADNGGSPLSSRQGTSGGTIGTVNALWRDDCGSNGGPAVGFDTLPFAGIVATPVIDYSLSPPTLFLTSLCKDQFANSHWYLHALDLTTGYDVSGSPVEITASVSGSNNADDLANGSIPFMPQRQFQRSGLLEAPQPAITGVSPLIYIAFGTGIQETTVGYHGWIFAYNTSLSQQFGFATTNNGYNTTGSPPCCQNCSPCSTDTSTCGVSPNPPCCNTNCVPQDSNGKYFQNSPNWCGHGGGIWMSGRAPAANNISSVSHAFFGSGNGGFQQNNGNWSGTIMDFTVSSTNTDTSPSKSFTPYGGRAIAPPLTGSVCPNEGSGGACLSTTEVLNENDWDMAISGILLFTDSAGHNWLVVTDKAGYGYLLRQNQNWGYAFASGDTYNWFPFATVGSDSLCPNLTNPSSADCHRTTSLAFFNPSSGTPYLYLFPWQETLRAFQQSDNSAQTPTGSPTVTTSGTTVTGTGTHFTQWLIPGDQITINTSPTPTTLTVTGVTSDTLLTVNLSSNISAATTFTYNGYFINPIYDTHPVSSNVGYPGGQLAVTSNGSSGCTSTNSYCSEIIWALMAQESDGGVTSGQAARTAGTLLAYDNSLALKWYTTDAFCASAMALPTVVHGEVFVPTYAATSCPRGSGSVVTSGILVYK
jgi:hypothetical protein